MFLDSFSRKERKASASDYEAWSKREKQSLLTYFGWRLILVWDGMMGFSPGPCPIIILY
jgi:hypothetical protein